MFASEGSGFPPLGERWLRAALDAPIPPEPRTTCGTCAMLREEPFPAPERFERETKCCTFFPNLASFLVGGLLLDEDPTMARGAALVADRVREGLCTSPFGVGRPEIFLQLYLKEGSFGHARGLRCPYFIDEDGGLCGVWRHREATCSTWFCKYERGRVGQAFWNAARNLLSTIERRLSGALAADLGIDPEALRALEREPFELTRSHSEEHYAAIWGPWAGRELEYFAETARRAAPLDWDAVRARCGKSLDEPLGVLAATHERLLDRELPVFGHLVRHEQLGADQVRVRLRTFSVFDPLDLTPDEARALAHFDGLAVPQAVERARAEGVELGEDTLRRLFDFGVLRE